MSDNCEMEVIADCVKIAAKYFPMADWDCLSIDTMKADDYIGDSITALTSWDSDGNCKITLMDSIANETDLRDTMAHELAHFVMGELYTETHNARPHGAEWFAVYCVFQRDMIWIEYYPEDWK